MSDIFDKIPELNYSEPAIETNFDEFKKVVESRRSVRVYTADDIPDSVVEECLDLALLAPNSSNLQAWDFYWVKTPEKKKALVKACFNQPAARTAPTLIACVARTGTWSQHSKMMAELLKKEKAPKGTVDYYEKLAPFVIFRDRWVYSGF